MSLSLNKASEQVVLSLNKRGITNIPKDINVSLLLDYSISMSSHYNNGNVSRVLQRLLSISNVIDDDGKLELVIFENGANHVGTLDVNQFDSTDSIVRDICNKYSMGGTYFAPAIDKILSVLSSGSSIGKAFSGFFSKKPAVEGKQLLVMISDGDNSDQVAFAKAVKTIESMPNVYLQCVAIGYDSRSLRELADQSDSVGYSSVSDFTKTDEDLINSVINPELLQKFA
jgi:hypothetical protein